MKRCSEIECYTTTTRDGKRAFIYGICSKIPRSFSHYLLVDIDTPSLETLLRAAEYLNLAGKRYTLTPTLHGFHIVVWEQLSLKQLSEFCRAYLGVIELGFRLESTEAIGFFGIRLRLFRPGIAFRRS
jgi:hypothetical protein